MPASYVTVEDLRRQVIPPEVADERAQRYASQVRAAMGWGKEQREAKLRALALEQVAESRREREWVTDSKP